MRRRKGWSEDRWVREDSYRTEKGRERVMSFEIKMTRKKIALSVSLSLSPN